jgi:hypothetical protein
VGVASPVASGGTRRRTNGDALMHYTGVSGRKWGGVDSGANGDGERRGFLPEGQNDAGAINEGSSRRKSYAVTPVIIIHIKHVRGGAWHCIISIERPDLRMVDIFLMFVFH